jgi:hypothetical protein
MKSCIKSSVWIFILLCLLASTLNGQEKHREPPKDPIQNLQPPPQTIEDLEQELGIDWENRILEDVKNEYPAELDNLQKLKSKNLQKYQQKLIKFHQEIRRELRLKVEDPQQYQAARNQHELDHLCDSLAQQYRETKDKQRQAEIKNDLRKKLVELFVLRETEKEQRIAELEQEIKQLKEMGARRRQKQDEIISKRLDEMLGEQDELEW